MYREGEAGMVVVMVMEESVGEGEGEHSWLQYPLRTTLVIPCKSSTVDSSTKE